MGQEQLAAKADVDTLTLIPLLYLSQDRFPAWICAFIPFLVIDMIVQHLNGDGNDDAATSTDLTAIQDSTLS